MGILPQKEARAFVADLHLTYNQSSLQHMQFSMLCKLEDTCLLVHVMEYMYALATENIKPFSFDSSDTDTVSKQARMFHKNCPIGM
jgi:hypothetical protein